MVEIHFWLRGARVSQLLFYSSFSNGEQSLCFIQRKYSLLTIHHTHPPEIHDDEIQYKN